MALESGSNVYESGLQLAEDGRHEEALGRIEQHLQRNPDDAVALNDAGAISYCLGRSAEAVRHLEKARDIKGDCGEILWNLVEAYILDGRPEKAAGLFDDMQRLGLLSPDVLNKTAKEFLAQADKGNAIEMLLRSLQLAPNQEILEPMIEVVRSKRPKIAFFCGLSGDVKFLTDICEFSKLRYPAEFFEGRGVEQMQELMQSSDIAWFEWCTDMVVAASKLPKVCKNIVRLHRFEAYGGWPKQVQWENIDVLITVGNSFVKDALLGQVGDIESRTRLITIPNGVNLDKFKFVDRQRGKNIACVGYLNMRKNPMFLLQCMQKLHYIDGEYKFFFAGNFQDPMLEQYIRHMVDALELGGVAFFDGWQEDINAWLEDKHYIVSASIGESQGMGLLEGMACGLKPVIHNFPGAEQIFGSEFLFNISEDFCQQILCDAYEPQRYRRFVEQRYPLEAQLSCINDIFVEFEKELDASAEQTSGVSISTPAPAPVLSAKAEAGARRGGGPEVPDFTGSSSLRSRPEPGWPEVSFEQSSLPVQSNEVQTEGEFPGLGLVSTGSDCNVFAVGGESTVPGTVEAEPLVSAELAVAGQVFKPPAKPPLLSAQQTRGVLVEFNAVIGDVLCMEPAIRALKKQSGQNVDITVRTNHPELFRNHPSISSVEDINLSGPGGVDYEQKFTLSWVATREVRGFHLVDRAARQMGVELDDRLVRMYLDSWDYAQLEKFNLPKTAGAKIVIGAGVRWPSRRWGNDKWQQLCRLLEQKFGASVIQLGVEGESFQGCGIDLVGKTSIREAAAIISQSELFIGTDNGLAHIAAAVAAPRVVLFGPVLPQKRMHPGPGRAVVSPGTCRGCLHLDDWDETPPRICPKGHNECMKLISVQAVFEAALDLLGSKKREGLLNG